jgi:hypothetical protein
MVSLSISKCGTNVKNNHSVRFLTATFANR